jgi:hypothetical protein
LFRRIEHRARPARGQPGDVVEHGAVGVGLAGGDEGEVVLWNIAGQRHARHDIERVQLHGRALEQELERRVGAEIARRGEGEEAQRRRRR